MARLVSGCLIAGVMTLALGCAASAPPVGESGMAIQGGAPWQGDPAVGLLAMTNGFGFCTGTLVSPKVVLTAAHCMEEAGGAAIDAFYVGAGRAVVRGAPIEAENMVRYAVESREILPGFAPAGAVCPITTGDLAVVKLKEPVAGIAPLPLIEAERIGYDLDCRAVGFGRYDDEGGLSFVGEKRGASVRIVDFVSHTVVVRRGLDERSGIADTGDSGSPLLCEVGGATVVAAVASCHTDGEGWDHAQEYYSRIDPHAAWLRAAITP